MDPTTNYDTQYVCRYADEDLFAQSHMIDEDEKAFIRDTLYREDVLNIFCVGENRFDEVMSGPLIPELVKRLTEHSVMKACMTKVAGVWACIGSEDRALEMGLCMLFSYEFLDASHPCICDYLTTGQISEEHMNALQKRVRLEQLE